MMKPQICNITYSASLMKVHFSALFLDALITTLHETSTSPSRCYPVLEAWTCLWLL